MASDISLKDRGFRWEICDQIFSHGPELDTVHNPLFSAEQLGVDWALNAAIDREEAELAASLHASDMPVTGNGRPVHLGIDSEWEYDPEREANCILSYQFYLLTEQGILSGLVYPKTSNQRLQFESFIGGILHTARREGLMEDWPRTVFVYAHFLRADITHFGGFWKTLKTQLDGLRGTVTSIKGHYDVGLIDEDVRPYRPKPMVLRDEYRHPRRCFVRFIDTMLLTPDKKGLADVGELIGLPKLELPEGYGKHEMKRLLAEQPEAFQAYALRDAEIAVRYGLRMHSFAQELGLSRLPPTLGTLAVNFWRHCLHQTVGDSSLITAHYENLFGLQSLVKETFWDKRRARPVTRHDRQPTVHRLAHEAVANRCYHGGRGECFYSGPTPEGVWNDFDLQGAYLTALASLRALDYERAYISHRVADFRGDVCGFAHVRFRFPETTRFPCLPVRAGQRGLYFPLSGEAYCVAHELSLAERLGAEIEILHGVIVPWHPSGERVFEPFVLEVRQRRLAAKAEGDQFMDQLVKEIGNSLYGKLSQGLKETKTHFEPRSGGRVKAQTSLITHPYLAAYVTGLIRAVVGELLVGVPAHRTVVSVTTDGFLTDACLEEIDCSGPQMRHFQDLIARLDSSTRSNPYAGLERKHQVAQLVAMRTRGCLTVKTLDGQPPILAKSSIKPPVFGKEAQNAYMLDLYLKRVPGQVHDQSHLISMAEQWHTERDLVSVKRTVRVNLEFDFKREPINPRMVSMGDVEHLAFDTRPWVDMDLGIAARAMFDGWRAGGCLRTLEDWAAWEEFYQARLAADGTGIRVTKTGVVGLLRRQFLCAYTNEQWGICKRLSYSKLAAWLGERGYPTTVEEVKNAKRARLCEQAVPVTATTRQLWDVLCELYPDLDARYFFRPSPALEDLLAAEVSA